MGHPQSPPPNYDQTVSNDQAQNVHPTAVHPPPQVIQPIFIQPLGFHPAHIYCITCHRQVQTAVEFKVGNYALLIFVVFVFAGLILGCCLIPLCCDIFKDAHHYCPHCHNILAIRKRQWMFGAYDN